MSIETEGLDPSERIQEKVLPNVTMDATRFCLEKCGFASEAFEQGAMMSAFVSGDTVVVTSGPEGVNLYTDAELPEMVAKCKGPRKKFLFVGELVCRGRATIEKA